MEIEFDSLDSHDQSQFSKYLTSQGTIRVRKLLNKDSTPEYHGYCEIPEDAWLQEANIASIANRDSINKTPLKGYVPPAGRITKEIVEQAQVDFIDANRGKIKFKYDLETSHFLGARSVAQGIFGEIFFIPAVKSAGDEFAATGKSIFSQLFSNVINGMSGSNTAYIEAKQKITELTKNLNKTVTDGSQNSNRPEQISKLEQLLEAQLQDWNTKIEIEITPPDIDEVMKLGTSVWVDDGVPTDVDRKGNGLQRSLIFALIKAWVEVQSTNDVPNEGRSASNSRYSFLRNQNYICTLRHKENCFHRWFLFLILRHRLYFLHIQVLLWI